MYAGALGAAQDVVGIARAFLATDLPNSCHLVILGAGTQESKLRDLARRHPTRIHFLDRMPSSEIHHAMAASDIQLAGFADPNIARLSMPSKVQSSLASGKGLLSTGPGDLSDLIRSHQVGFASDTSEDADIRKAFHEAAAAGRSGLRKIGRRARSLYLRDFAVATSVARVERVLYEAAGSRCGSRDRTRDLPNFPGRE